MAVCAPTVLGDVFAHPTKLPEIDSHVYLGAKALGEAGMLLSLDLRSFYSQALVYWMSSEAIVAQSVRYTNYKKAMVFFCHLQTSRQISPKLHVRYGRGSTLEDLRSRVLLGRDTAQSKCASSLTKRSRIPVRTRRLPHILQRELHTIERPCEWLRQSSRSLQVPRV